MSDSDGAAIGDNQCTGDQISDTAVQSETVQSSEFEDDTECKNDSGYIDSKRTASRKVILSKIEQSALSKVREYAASRSCNVEVVEQLRSTIGTFQNGKYRSSIDDTVSALQRFLEHEAPILIRVHIKSLIPKIANNSHYRNLFEVGSGSTGIDAVHRRKMGNVIFQNAYDDAEPFEGIVDVALFAARTQQVTQFGDGYLQLRDATVRWRTSITIVDSFNVRGDVPTLQHCNHLLVQLLPDELQEIVEAALHRKSLTKGTRQRSDTEVQIHGPLRFGRDVESVIAPSRYQKDKNMLLLLQKFCSKNKCALHFIEPPTPNQQFKGKMD